MDLRGKRIEGYVTLSVTAQTATSRLVLDTRGLEIVAVEAARTDAPATPLRYTHGEPQGVLGSALTVSLPSELAEGGTATVGVHFRVGEVGVAGVAVGRPSERAIEARAQAK